MVGISFCFSTGLIFSFYLSSESDFPMFSWVDLETKDGPVYGGVIMYILSVGGGEHVVGVWWDVPVLEFSS